MGDGSQVRFDRDGNFVEMIAAAKYDPIFGARPLKRLIQKEIVDRIAQKVVEGNLRDRSHVLISIDQDGNYECTVEEPLELDASALDDLLTSGEK